MRSAQGSAPGAGVIALGSGVADLPRFLIFVAATFAALVLVFLAIAVLVSALTDRRVVALASGAFIWFFFVLPYDAIALAAAT